MISTTAAHAFKSEVMMLAASGLPVLTIWTLKPDLSTCKDAGGQFSHLETNHTTIGLRRAGAEAGRLASGFLTVIHCVGEGLRSMKSKPHPEVLPRDEGGQHVTVFNHRNARELAGNHMIPQQLQHTHHTGGCVSATDVLLALPNCQSTLLLFIVRHVVKASR